MATKDSVQILTCLRLCFNGKSYRWVPRLLGVLPRRCPNCQSRKWNEPRTKTKGGKHDED